MKFFLYSIFLMTLFGCNRNDDNIPEILNSEDNFKIESYYFHFANYSTTLYPNSNSDNLVKFKYDNDGKIIKRLGDILYFSTNAGFGPIISDSLYTDLVYFDNKVKLTKKMKYLGYTTLENESIITFDLLNRLQKKTNKYQNPSGEIVMDTINFAYDSSNKLINYVKTTNHHTTDFDYRNFEESTLYYNSQQNLDSIVTVYYLKYSDATYKVYSKKKTVAFENYDNSYNPFKKLSLFEETFYRSLSNNNYKKYTEKSKQYYYPDFDFYLQPLSTPTTIDKVINWNFNYDMNGNWMYNLP